MITTIMTAKIHCFFEHFTKDMNMDSLFSNSIKVEPEIHKGPRSSSEFTQRTQWMQHQDQPHAVSTTPMRRLAHACPEQIV